MFRLIYLLLFLGIHTLSVFAQQTVGLFINDSTAFQGYVLFSNNEQTYLIDNCGLVVNQWESAYKSAGAVYLLENGNLLRTSVLEGDFNAGGKSGRFELFNWEGDLLWFYEYANNAVHAHHDIEPLPNGNFLALAWEKHSQNEAQQNGRRYEGEIWSERIVEIEMVGYDQANIVWEWRLWDHLIQQENTDLPNYGTVAQHPELVHLNYIGSAGETSGNWIHLNAIDYHKDLDQIAVSSRLFSEIWLLDHSTTTAEAAAHSGGNMGKGGDLLYRYGNPQTYDRGTAVDQVFFLQHDVRWIPAGYPNEGKLMVFNNGTAAQAQSSVNMWTPPIDENGAYLLAPNQAYDPSVLDWTYTTPDFYSQYMSSAQVLPNGHVFVCEGTSGHFFELDANETIVWEYINPVNPNGGPALQGSSLRFNQTFRATKYPFDYPAFTTRTLTASQPIELNPLPTDCYIPMQPETEDDMLVIAIVNNPVEEVLHLQTNLEQTAWLHIVNVMGQVVGRFELNDGLNLLDVSRLKDGLYLLSLKNEVGAFYADKFIKK